MWRPDPQPEPWPHADRIIGPVTMPTRAYALADRYCADVTLRFGTRGLAARVAYERIILRLRPGEPIRAISAARVAGYGHAVLAATPQQLLGDGEGGWTCDAPWAAFTYEGPEPWLVVAGISVELAGPEPHQMALMAVAGTSALEYA